MSVVETTIPAPGWYPDPHEATSLRWWDGSAWTHFTAVPPRAGPEPTAENKADPRPEPEPEAKGVEADAVPLAMTVIQVDGRQAPASAPAPAVEIAPRPFSFRARPMELEPEAVQFETGVAVPLPADASPLNAIKAPAAPPKPPRRKARRVEREPEPASAQDEKRTRRLSRKAAAGTAAVVVAATGAAGATNLLRHDDPASPPGRSPAAGAPIAGPLADKSCLKEWNTATSGDAAQLRVTLGQFTGALARVSRVSPLPGTLMQPDSCGLTVYDPKTDAHGVFVSGLKGQVGYLEVTAYPRAARYGWPKTESQANVVIRQDGSLRAR